MRAVPGSHPINSMRKLPRCPTRWEPAGSLNLLCDFVTWPLAGPIPCSPAPLAAYLAEGSFPTCGSWHYASRSLWNLIIECVSQPSVDYAFPSKPCPFCEDGQFVQSLILLYGLTCRSFECSFFIRVLLVILKILMQQPRPFFLLGIRSSLLALIWCGFIQQTHISKQVCFTLYKINPLKI